MKLFAQRSSWASSLITGITGWLGTLAIGSLILSQQNTIGSICLLSLAGGTVQVLLLRMLFFRLNMHKHLVYGALWGGISGSMLFFAALPIMPELAAHAILWSGFFVFNGINIGGYLSYFHIDDNKIRQEAHTAGQRTDYGRDAHWLEPVAFGVFAYLAGCLPISLETGVMVLLTGAFSGVVAAGFSHFSPDSWKSSPWKLGIMILAMGSLQGLLSGSLFISIADDILAPWYLAGITGGILTYATTLIRGKALAKRYGPE